MEQKTAVQRLDPSKNTTPIGGRVYEEPDSLRLEDEACPEVVVVPEIRYDSTWPKEFEEMIDAFTFRVKELNTEKGDES